MSTAKTTKTTKTSTTAKTSKAKAIKPTEIKVIPCTNSRYEELKRKEVVYISEAKTNETKAKAKLKSAYEDFWCILSGISFCVFMCALGFLMWIL